MLFTRDPRQAAAAPRDTRRLYAAYEIAYTAVDFTAAILFVAGSVMFFSDAWQTAGTWLFVIGSLCFAAKPTIRLVRELHLARRGDWDDIRRHDG